MKTIAVLLLAFANCFALVGCSGANSDYQNRDIFQEQRDWEEFDRAMKAGENPPTYGPAEWPAPVTHDPRAANHQFKTLKDLK